MRRDGVDASGLEPGIEFADFARTVLGVPIQTAAVDAATIPAESQDLVTMFHALEHVPDPLAVLTTVRTGSGAAVIWSSKCPTSPRACRRRTTSITTRICITSPAARSPRWGRRPACGSWTPDTPATAATSSACFGAQATSGGLAGLEAGRGAHAGCAQVAYAGAPLPSAVPYLRALRRLRRRIAENRVLRRIRTVEDAVRWADSLT